MHAVIYYVYVINLFRFFDEGICEIHSALKQDVFMAFFCEIWLHPHINISWKYYALKYQFKLTILYLATEHWIVFFFFYVGEHIVFSYWYFISTELHLI
jgi:hypothetical protein